ncbi:Glutaminyl-tRNA synthetase, partial [Coemansia sp. RSA 353]
NHIRDALNVCAPRIMALVRPVRVVLENLPENYFEEHELVYHPSDTAFGSRRVPFTRTLFIDSSDFRESDSPGYFRLAPNKTVGLNGVPYPITCTGVRRAADGSVSEVLCRYENEASVPKPKAYIQWVADSPQHGSPVRIDELRVYNPLFKHANPDEKSVTGGFMNDVSETSLEIIHGAVADIGLWDSIKRYAATDAGKKELNEQNVETLRFQFMRIGYFALDKDSSMPLSAIESDQIASTKLVMNRIVTLKEDAKKDA